jgi:phosphatidylglycerophosphate synthase
MRGHGKERLTVRHTWLVGPLTLAAGLTVLGASVGLAAPQWIAGVALGLAVTAVVVRGSSGAARLLSPADLVTLSRAMLACCVAALVVDQGVDEPATRALVAVASVALVLDLVDGRVARRTRTSAFGARFDGEADAFLILVLSVEVAASGRPWVLLIGAARYLFGVAGRRWAWLAAPLPFRYWRKVVTATQGVVLVTAAAGVLPPPLVTAALLVALALLAESFGRDVVWSWRHRSPDGAGRPVVAPVRVGATADVVAAQVAVEHR